MPRRSRSPGTATSCDNEPLTARFAPVDARVIRYFVLTVILAFVVGVVPLTLLLMTTGGTAEAGAQPEGGDLGLLLVPL